MTMLFALLAGALSVFAYAPFEIFPLALICWGALFYLLSKAPTRRKAAWLGFIWGLGAFVAGLCWLYIALNRYGGMAPPLAALAIVLFCAYLAIYPAFSAWLFALVRRDNRQNGWQNALFAAASWTLGEWLRGTVFTGFPWLAIGYTQTPPSPLAGWAAVFGVYGMGFLLTLSAALCWTAVRDKAVRWKALAAVLVLWIAGGLLYTVQWTHPVGQPTRFSLLQTNIAQEMKWRSDLIGKWLQLNDQMVREHPAQVIVMPETSLPLLEEDLPPGYMESLRNTARAAGGDVIIGTFTRDKQGQVFNSALTQGISPTQHYSKNHLVPFGEFSPPLFGWFYKWADIPMSDQARGGASQPPLQLAGQKIAINICYEDLFGEGLIYALPEATIMINMSNLAWYGKSHAQPQHLQIARIRALETGRPMLRATNTGMTAVVEPNGMATQVLPEFTSGALVADVRGYQGLTPYARWGNWPVLALCFALLGWGLWSRKKAMIHSI